MSATGRLSTGRFGSLPIGSTNVAIWWKADVLALSEGSMSAYGLPLMEQEYRDLRAGWTRGDRDRERALHLLYLAWWHWAEPDFLTGLSDDPEAVNVWRDVFDYFKGERSFDAEFLFVAGTMVTITPWMFGEERAWTSRAEAMKERSLCLRPTGFVPDDFEGRGDFGEYFAHQARV